MGEKLYGLDLFLLQDLCYLYQAFQVNLERIYKLLHFFSVMGLASQVV